jgi:hypothetical protein
MKKSTRFLFFTATKANWANSLKRLSFLCLGIILSFSTLSAADYCHFAIQSTSATPQTAYITCQSLGGTSYEFKFETSDNTITSWVTGSNFYSEVNGIGGTQVSNNLVKSSDSKTLTWTVTSSPKPNIYVANFTVTFATGGAHTFNIPTDENFAAVCTIAGIPTLAATASATGITTTTATSGGNITAEGTSAVTARGVCWGTATAPTVALATKTADGAGIGSFTSNITGLSSGVKYYVRAYATNSAGTAYGNEISFISPAVPILSTLTLTSFTSTTVSTTCSVSIDGEGVVNSRGVCWSTSANPTIESSKTSDGSDMGSFTSSITGLIANRTYYV